MPDPSGLQKAQFVELDGSFQEKKGGKSVRVQFNPESLKVSFSNQISQSGNKGEQPRGNATNQGDPASQQFVGAGSTKLALQLWFDVSAGSEPLRIVGDVRDLTKEVAYFITPIQVAQGFIPPAVRFLWGSFHFDGIIDSMEETLEFFSGDGVPLRASVSLTLSQQKILKFSGGGTGVSLGLPGVGALPMVSVQAGATLQGIADSLGRGSDWQAIASANNIENPRILAPGSLIAVSRKG